MTESKQIPNPYEEARLSDVMSGDLYDKLVLLYYVSNRRNFGGFCEDLWECVLLCDPKLEALWNAVDATVATVPWLRTPGIKNLRRPDGWYWALADAPEREDEKE
ncbi:MAG: hypothetical protein ISS49_10470 [Anaerolineae bacterium]|nr:hypothetical protein [Anaerolineae bacterium]